MAKKTKNIPTPKIAKVKVTGKLDSLTDILKQRLFEYSPQSVDELLREAQALLVNQTPTKVQKNLNRCLTKNPSFRSEGKGLWCLRLDGLKENDAAHRILQANGDAMRLSDINQKLKETGKAELPGEQKLVTDGRFLRLKDGRWGLIHWAYIEPEERPAGSAAIQEVAASAVSRAKGKAESEAGSNGQSQAALQQSEGKGGSVPGSKETELFVSSTLPLAKPAPLLPRNDFWDKLFPIKSDNKENPFADTKAKFSLPGFKPGDTNSWEEVAAGAETAAISLDTREIKAAAKEFSLINGGKAGTSRLPESKDEEKARLLREIEDLRQENRTLLGDLEKLHRRREEMRQELIQIEEQLVSLRVERDTSKKRISHLETRLMQLQGTLNKTVSDAQAEQSRLKQQLREQEYRLQTTLIANEDLERSLSDLQKERQELKRQLSFWPVRLVLRLCSLFGLKPREKPRTKSKKYGRY
ncbi:MAG: hypothetical protein GX039_08845 [Clostridia bacterium]|nr:hypothetical protein [Clostridia bacterium]